MATEEQRIAVERLMPFTIHISDSELDNSTLEEDAQLAKVTASEPILFRFHFPRLTYVLYSMCACVLVCFSESTVGA